MLTREAVETEIRAEKKKKKSATRTKKTTTPTYKMAWGGSSEGGAKVGETRDTFKLANLERG